MKTCTECGHTGPLEDFHKNPTMKDGHLNQCTGYVRKYNRERWRSKPRVSKKPNGRRVAHNSKLRQEMADLVVKVARML